MEELKLAKQDGQMFSQFNQATDSIVSHPMSPAGKQIAVKEEPQLQNY